MSPAETRTKRLPRPAAGGAAILAVLTWACGQAPPDEPQEISTVDVPAPLAVDVDQDPRADRERARLVGVLPEDFPPDLPIPLPASVIDFGDAGGGRFVTLLSTRPPAQIRPELEGSLRDQGWQPVGESWRKGTRRVRLRIEAETPGTLYRYEY